MIPKFLVALDIDGTLLNSKHEITPATKQAIWDCRNAGAEIVLSTGRTYEALPFPVLEGLGFQYAITTNGAAIYRIPDKKCLYENCMDLETFLPILKRLEPCDIMIHVYQDGECYNTASKHSVIDKMDVSEQRKHYLHSIGHTVESLSDTIIKHNRPVQKVTLGFYPLPDGTYKHHNELETFLRSNPAISTVCGGEITLEFTKAGVTKGKGLEVLANYLNIPMDHTIACGDSENDLDIIQTAAIGVAMSNASKELLHAADYITLSNAEDGVAHMLRKFILSKEHCK